ncbi:MAG TPA: TolC family protein [Gemmatimonadaceae bacterium]|nr:TolC family protein [Gemmatimonadaceae bacterium]
MPLLPVVTGVVLLLTLLATPSGLAAGQRAVSRADAVRAALDAGPRLALARADSSAARARELSARAFPNPTLMASYTKSAPQRHLEVELPLDAPWVRGARVRAAAALARAAELRLLSERDAVVVDADTTYTQALAAESRFRLARQTARDADSVRAMTSARRDAGDASDLDVDLATLAAGQQANAASDDSLAAMSVLLALQSAMGLPADSVAIVLADTLRPPGDDSAAAVPASLAARAGSASPSVAAAEASLRAAELGVASARRSVLGLPAITVGVEEGDPSGDEPGTLPVIGLALPIPLLDRNRGGIAEASAERARARAELASARLETRRRIVEGTRERDALRVRVARDAALVDRAVRVAARSLTAYREGAFALPAVLEARRTAREVQLQYIDDVASLLIVESELRALARTVPAP